MQEVFNNKKKLCIITIVLFLITSLILKIIPNNIGNILSFIIFPISFFALTFLYYKYNKVNWYLPVLLTLALTVVGYIIIPNIIFL